MKINGKPQGDIRLSQLTEAPAESSCGGLCMPLLAFSLVRLYNEIEKLSANLIIPEDET